jgi:hypothetical protein
MGGGWKFCSSFLLLSSFRGSLSRNLPAGIAPQVPATIKHINDELAEPKKAAPPSLAVQLQFMHNKLTSL